MATPLTGTKDVVGMTDVIMAGEMMVVEETTIEAATLEEIGTQGVDQEIEVIITVSGGMIVVTVTEISLREAAVMMFVSLGKIAVIDSKDAAQDNTLKEVTADERFTL